MKKYRGLKIILFILIPILAISGIVYAVTRPVHYFANIPPGYIGRVLTPIGWDSKILDSGQIDLGGIGNGGIGNSLVLVEGATMTVREKFQEEAINDDAGDDRVLTRDGVPLTLTVYIRLTAPSDEQMRDTIFDQMTPAAQQDRVSSIRLEDVYVRFAKMDVRNRIRGIVASYDNYKSLYADFGGVNERINAEISGVFEKNRVPLSFQNAGISNAKPDQKVWDAENEKVAAQARADAMTVMSEAIKSDPNSLVTLKWQYLQKIAEVSANNGTKLIIITDTQDPEIANRLSEVIAGSDLR